MTEQLKQHELSGNRNPETVADFLKALPSEAEVKKRIEQNREEKKQLDRLLKIVAGDQ